MLDIDAFALQYPKALEKNESKNLYKPPYSRDFVLFSAGLYFFLRYRFCCRVITIVCCFVCVLFLSFRVVTGPRQLLSSKESSQCLINSSRRILRVIDKWITKTIRPNGQLAFEGRLFAEFNKLHDNHENFLN